MSCELNVNSRGKMRFRNSPLSLLDGQDGRGGLAVMVVVSVLVTPLWGRRGHCSTPIYYIIIIFIIT